MHIQHLNLVLSSCQLIILRCLSVSLATLPHINLAVCPFISALGDPSVCQHFMSVSWYFNPCVCLLVCLLLSLCLWGHFSVHGDDCLLIGVSVRPLVFLCDLSVCIWCSSMAENKKNAPD